MVKKYQRAVAEQVESKEYFTSLTDAAPAELIPTWTEEVTYAEQHRGNQLDVMDVYQARIPKAKGRRDIELELGQRKLEGELIGQASWISQGLKVEEAQ